jgi:hypothetical protein
VEELHCKGQVLGFHQNHPGRKTTLIPSREHALIMREMSDEILQVSPKASFFAWHVLDHDGFRPLDPPQVYVDSIHDDAGEWVGGEMLDSPENQIVAKYQEKLGWSARDEGIGYAYSVKEAREITDIEGTGHLTLNLRGARPGILLSVLITALESRRWRRRRG